MSLYNIRQLYMLEYMIRMSKHGKAMAVWFSVYVRYTVIGVIYMYIYDKVFDMEL